MTLNTTEQCYQTQRDLTQDLEILKENLTFVLQKVI